MDPTQAMLIQALMNGYREGTTPGGTNISTIPGQRADELALPGLTSLPAVIQGLFGNPLSPNQMVSQGFTSLRGSSFDPAFIKKAHE